MKNLKLAIIGILATVTMASCSSSEQEEKDEQPVVNITNEAPASTPAPQVEEEKDGLRFEINTEDGELSGGVSGEIDIKKK